MPQEGPTESGSVSRPQAPIQCVCRVKWEQEDVMSEKEMWLK